jgi:hypothetical protein
MASSEKAVVRPRAPGVISIHEIYALDELLGRMRWTQSSFRAARRHGLRVLGHGKRRYVRGRDIMRFLEQHVVSETYQSASGRDSAR